MLYGAEPSLQQLVISGDRRQDDATIRLSSTVARREQGNIRLYAVYFAPVKHYAAQSRRILVSRTFEFILGKALSSDGKCKCYQAWN